eukprot:CAMPEP_0113543844 /NCGR_PEP_ID=MMETSP0015_2-20120614/10380_1 /TAXON_ID=2838 /ORGANISM="Odontella" /LENGTH=612 /DNA_ID=CAMNT_0000444041 /DNA_START=599 /DNA_END=2437 /DNA_ORIENTATION=+ /assembly_acc=CAM_ASM_000160
MKPCRPPSNQISASTETAKMTRPQGCLLIELIPSEMQLSIITHLRAVDLSSLQRTCGHFNSRCMINSVIEHIAEHVYPPDLTEGFDTPIVGGEVNAETIGNGHLTYEALRNMEMLVTVRVLSRPEPPIREREHGFYVSKSWCKAALRWLEVQQEEREKESQRRLAEAELLKRNPHASKKKRNKKLSKKEQRLHSRKQSDALPPWPNVNDDIACPHNELARCSKKFARAKRRVLDKQAWRVLKKLYPDSVQLSSVRTECLLCAVEAETTKRNESNKREREKEERKKPLSCPIVRGIYTRSRGVPQNCLVVNSAPPQTKGNDDVKVGPAGFATPTKASVGSPPGCPLRPGVYNALPRSWCHSWRKYLKTGEGDRPLPPDASFLLCDGHRLPLVPPHLESYLYGETPSLLTCSGTTNIEDASCRSFAVGSQNAETISSPFSPVPVGYNPVISSSDTDVALRAAGLSELELQSQRLAMLRLEREQHQEVQESLTPQTPRSNLRRNSSQENLLSTPDMTREFINEKLDRENYLVVEILTDEEFAALEKWWPEIHSLYALRFAVTTDTSTSLGANINWISPPCRECDASGKNCKEFVGRLQRARRIRRHGHVANGKGR